MPEIPTTASGGIPKWLMIGGAIASVLGLYALVKKQQSSGSTVAAGTSINAALGSLQEALLQTQGQIGESAQRTQDMVGASNVTNANNFAALSNQIQTDVTGIAAGQQSASDQNMANFTAILAPGGTDAGRVQAWQDAAVGAATQSNASFDAGANTAAQLTAAATGTH